MDNCGILEKLEQAEMVLVGLGEDFDDMRVLQKSREYLSGCEMLKEAGLQWMLPAWGQFCGEKSGSRGYTEALEKLSGLLKGKNHFAVSVSTDSRLALVGRIVMPCGNSRKKQCSEGCEGAVAELTGEDGNILEEFFARLYEGRLQGKPVLSGTCPQCGASFVLNNIYAEKYSEEGYLEQWNLYMKWLQGTLNRRLLVLELGVGMRFPSVIRWPFEKAAFFNQKAYFVRVNEKLYQLTKELSEKGCGISKNAVDWLGQL